MRDRLIPLSRRSEDDDTVLPEVDAGPDVVKSSGDQRMMVTLDAKAGFCTVILRYILPWGQERSVLMIWISSSLVRAASHLPFGETTALRVADVCQCKVLRGKA